MSLSHNDTLNLRSALRVFGMVLAWAALTVSAVAAPEDDARARGTGSGGVFNAPGYPVPARPGESEADRSRAPGGTGAAGAQRDADGRLRDPRNLQGPRQDREREPSVRQGQTLQPPARPSEFQRFVETATGRQLPVFGADFFADAAGSFAPVDNVPVPSDYAVGPGDEVLIRAWGAIDVDYRATVDRNGLINLPRVGSFPVAGVRASELERHLRAQIGRLYTNFNLSVTLGQLRAVKVYVVGQAQRPGVYTLSSQSSLLSAVVASGGPGVNGSMRKISLKRDGRIVSELDVYEFLVQGDRTKDVQLLPGDVVVFHPVGPRVALTGAIDTPAVYELRSKEEPLRDVLRYAGGTSVLANPHQVQIERIDPAARRAARLVEEFKLDDTGLAKNLRDGDILTLLAISPQFGNAVTLKGHVAQPLRYPHRPGMRVSDLIPDKEALISPEFYRRKNLLVQVELLDANGDEDTGRSGAEDTIPRNGAFPQMQGSNRRQTRADQQAAERAKKAPAALFDEINWDYAVIERLKREDLSTQLITFNLRAALAGDGGHNVELQPGDVVTVFSQKDMRVPVSKQIRLVTVEGEVGAPGVYQLLPGETLRQLLGRAGGFTQQAYVYGIEFSREETRVRQRENLQAAIQRLESLAATQAAREAANQRADEAGRSSQVSAAATQAQLQRLRTLQPNGRIALELDYARSSIDTLPDVPLDNGDRILVPARPGFVTVSGAVANNNAYLWKPGRTAGDYVKLAGTEEAADTSQMFILRADGTVMHGNDRRGLFTSGVASAELHPGDAVIIPNQLDYETWGRALVRNLKDWSAIFYQFGLGAAAIQTLRNN
ncbi:polysaccharide biosynthesis/export family protein [Methylibium rhizosphaerae]|uniref:polysaccharide biosynthesis/export family protein n=1 Tax=Methylibium rhizosphaerae TaxID=2570323 RepID=UPI0015E2CD69|nr:SLBB domain-containing protein [Methylibium rhizosphaerae]